MIYTTNEVVCPRCKRIERANVDQERLVLCSRCALAKAIHAPEPKETPEEKRAKKFHISKRKEGREKPCKQCGELFTPKSKWQRYCAECHGEGEKK